CRIAGRDYGKQRGRAPEYRGRADRGSRVGADQQGAETAGGEEYAGLFGGDRENPESRREFSSDGDRFRRRSSRDARSFIRAFGNFEGGGNRGCVDPRVYGWTRHESDQRIGVCSSGGGEMPGNRDWENRDGL